MGLTPDLSAITPGPGGTTMLGEEGGIEAAARRGRECIRRREAAQTAAAMNDSMAEATLVPRSEATSQRSRRKRRPSQVPTEARERTRTMDPRDYRVRDWMRRHMMP